MKVTVIPIVVTALGTIFKEDKLSPKLQWETLH